MRNYRFDVAEKRTGSFPLFLAALIGAAFLGGMIAILTVQSLGLFEMGATANQVIENEEGKIFYDQDTTLVSAVSDKVAPAVVSVSNISTEYYLFDKQQEVEKGIGSGVIISEDGYIITNYHVIEGAEKIVTGLSDGSQVEAKVVGCDQRSDLAVLKIEKSGLSYLAFADSDQIKVGQLAIAIGNPGGSNFARSVTLGVVSGINRLVANGEGQQFRLIQTDAAINPGNSGGPLVNIRGELIGITSIKISASSFEGMGFAIPSNTVKDVAGQLISKGKVTRPALEVEILADVTQELALNNGLSIDYGVVVSPIAGGAAEKAGMKIYDIIIEINGNKIDNSYILQEEVFNKAVGETVKIKAIRSNKEVSFEVILSELID